jgi:hypothetical protein
MCPAIPSRLWVILKQETVYSALSNVETPKDTATIVSYQGELKVSGTFFIAIRNLQQVSPVASRSSRGGGGASKSGRDYRTGAAQPQGKKVTSDK